MPRPAADLRQRADEGERLGQHEATRAGPLHCVADRVEAHRASPRSPPCVCRIALEVGDGLGLLDVDVSLPLGERRPDQATLAAVNEVGGEGQAGPRPVDAGELVLGRPCRERPSSSSGTSRRALTRRRGEGSLGTGASERTCD